MASQHDKGSHANGPYVYFKSVAFLLENFGGDVVDRAANWDLFLVVQNGGKAEIGDFDNSVGANDEVFELDIVVDNVVAVEVNEAFYYVA